MKLLKQLENDFCTAHLYVYNNKYIIKFEVANLEQIYKVSEFDVTGEEDVEEMLGEAFMKKVMARFEQMSQDLDEVLDSVD